MNENDAKQTLRKGHERGRWEVEHLDQPSPGRYLLEQDCKRNPNLPPGFKLPPYRNLLRELFNL